MLTRPAFFNSITAFADQFAIIVVSLLLTPKIVATLGMTGFAVWQLVLRGSRYLSLMDGRSHELLKWQISRATVAPEEEKRQLTFASVAVWFCYLPVFLGCAVAYHFWIASYSESNGVISEANLSLSALLMVLSALIVALSCFPEAVIRGSNLGYKQFGIRFASVLLVGLGSYVSLGAGLGLTGLAAMHLVGGVLLFIGLLFVASKNLSWLGFSKPTLMQTKDAFSKGIWYFAWSVANFGFNAIDLILLGVLASTSDVGIFAITFYAIQMVLTAVTTIIGAVLPGLGTLFGKQDYSRLRSVRAEGVNYTFHVACAIGMTVLLFNESFISIWVGREFYAGTLENCLTTIVAMQMVFIRNDALLINLLLDQKQKVKISMLSCALIITLACVLIPQFGITGLCVSLILGRSILNFGYPRIIKSSIGHAGASALSLVPVRAWLVNAILLVVAAGASSVFEAETWSGLIIFSGSVFLVISLCQFYLGFSQPERDQFYKRVSLATGKH